MTSKAKGRSIRHRARETVVQLLYELEALQGFDNPEPAISGFFRELAATAAPDLHPEARSFAKELCRGLVRRIDEVDRQIAAASRNWRLERMNRVDLAVLRLGTYELLLPDGPPGPVVLSEAVALARAFGSNDSATFVNGVLGQVARTLGKAPNRPRRPT